MLRLADSSMRAPVRRIVDEQLIDAFGRIVMDPIRQIGNVLDTVEVGPVVVAGLGEVGAEVGIAAAPSAHP
jgi:hypothetical protein